MSKVKVAAVIPARMASTRYPGKPLARILDLPMVEHVRRRTLAGRGLAYACHRPTHYGNVQ